MTKPNEQFFSQSDNNLHFDEMMMTMMPALY
jgi:heat shock protein HslJ